ncbi:Tkl protein kinase, partial [Globisporangium splendens]
MRALLLLTATASMGRNSAVVYADTVVSDSSSSGDNSTSSSSVGDAVENPQQNWMLLAVISVAVLFVLVLSIVSFVLYRRHKKLKQTEELEYEVTTNATKATQFIHGSISTLTRPGDATTGSAGYHPEFEYLPNDIRTDEEMQPYRLQQREVVRGKLLAKGGYGAVYKARFRNETVVVKQLLPDKTRNKQILKSFMDEIRICASLDHPKVVRFIGVTWSSLLDLSVVMEYMPNGDLGSLLTEQLQRQVSGTISRRDYGWFQSKSNLKCKSLIALDIAEALVYLHSFFSPIIHRDLKSRNVLLSKDWEAKLTDFGVSRELDEDQTMTGEIGTVSWIAPEVLRGERYTEKADIYSFGVIMTELDTCSRPYANGIAGDENNNGNGGSNSHTNTRIAVLVSTGSLKPSIMDDCPPSVRRVIMQCLEVDPKNRPSAVQIHFELRNLEVVPEEDERRTTSVSGGTIKRSGSGSSSASRSSKAKNGGASR